MTNDVPNYSDIQIEFSKKELKELKKKTKKLLAFDRIFGVEKLHFWIYLGLLIFSVLLLLPYSLLITNCVQANNVFSTLMSIGAGVIGAVVLAYLIEHSNILTADRKLINGYNNSIQNIHLTLWKVFMCKPLSVFRGNEAQLKPFLDHTADLYISYYEMAINLIDLHTKQYGDFLDAEKTSDFYTIKEQLVKFISDIRTRSDSAGRLLLLDGTKDWLKNHCTEEWLKKQFLNC